MSFTADHHGFYREERPFYPLIQEGSTSSAEANTILIRLPAQLQDDLNWSQEINLAKHYLSKGTFILWELDLGLAQYQFDPQDSTAFFSFSLALEEFSKTIWPIFKDQTLGVALYRGPFNPLFSFPLGKWEHSFSEWMKDLRCTAFHWPDHQADYSVYCAQNFAEYLHRLTSFLPEAVLPFVILDIQHITSSAQCAQLFSQERFQHIQLILRGSSLPYFAVTWEQGAKGKGWMGASFEQTALIEPASVGLYLPKDEMIDSTILAQLDALIAFLQNSNIVFRIVAEEKLTEQWDGLEQLYVVSQAVCAQGKRKLLGFIAAGGTVITYGEPLGLPEEVHSHLLNLN
jgi:hypothetical protein